MMVLLNAIHELLGGLLEALEPTTVAFDFMVAP